MRHDAGKGLLCEGSSEVNERRACLVQWRRAGAAVLNREASVQVVRVEVKSGLRKNKRVPKVWCQTNGWDLVTTRLRRAEGERQRRQ